MIKQIHIIQRILILPFLVCGSLWANSQVDDSQLGAWYAYHFKVNKSGQPWGIQGDLQWRNWNIAGDLEQVVLRAATTYRPEKTNLSIAVGYANVQTFSFGESANRTVDENRIFQDLTLPLQLGERILMSNRFRLEQRSFAGDEFRTRYRYNLSFIIPINQNEMSERTIYLQASNELFLNGVRGKGDREVDLFDRNRIYLGLGTFLKSNLKIQAGVMGQYLETTQKKQLQISLHHQ